MYVEVYREKQCAGGARQPQQPRPEPVRDGLPWPPALRLVTVLLPVPGSVPEHVPLHTKRALSQSCAGTVRYNVMTVLRAVCTAALRAQCANSHTMCPTNCAVSTEPVSPEASESFIKDWP